MKLPNPITERAPKNRRKLVQPYELLVPGLIHISIKQGFLYDGLSNPRFLWRVLGHPWQSETEASALVHDALYQTELLPRAQADNIFYQLMIIDEVAKAKAVSYYTGVKSGGWAVWMRHDKDGIRMAREYVTVYA